MKDTHFAYGYIATSTQTSVARVKVISTAARRLLRKPNWIGVKIKLKIRFKTNGSKTKKGICFATYIKAAYPYETVIRT